MTRGNEGRKKRGENSRHRSELLGYYLIVTDAEETEKNYFTGLRDSLPSDVRPKIRLKIISRVKTDKLVEVVENERAQIAQYTDAWIVLDRDKVVPFDNIIEQAEKRDIHVGWSNPCIELWFSAYFGEMPTFAGSPQCVSHFKKLFEQKTGTEYTKAIAEIYKKLNNNGDENNAIRIAKTQHKNMVNSCSKPSQMDSTTTLYILVEEIKKASL